MNKLRRRLRESTSNEVGGQMLQLAMGSAAATATTFLASPILARLFAPEAWGLAGLSTTVTTFASGVLLWGLAPAIIQEESEASARATYLAAARLALWSCAQLAALLLALVYFDSGGYGAFAPIHTVVTIAAAFTASLVRISRALASRAARFGVVSASTATSSWLRVGSRLALGVRYSSGLVLMATALVASSWRSLQMLWPFRSELRHDFRHRASVSEALRRNWRFPRHILPASVLTQLRQTILLPGLTAIYGLEAAGVYVLIGRLLGVPISLISDSVTDVVHRESARLTDPDALRRFVGKAVRLLMVAAALAVLASAVSWRWGLAQRVLGDRWTDVDAVLLALTPGLAARVVLQPVSRVIIVRERTEQKLVVDFLLFALTLALLVVGWWLGWTLIAMAWGISAVRVVGYVLYAYVLREALA